jgi:D-alanyl-lipoteichoic acid acyltransferase DltB (MBOAT superfamily)
MGSASFQFLGFAVVLIALFNLNGSRFWRQSVLLAANLIFLSFFSHHPGVWLPFAGFLAFGFISLRLMQNGFVRYAYIPIVIAGIAGFVWLKKYTFVPSAVLLPFPYITLGLSYIFFRVLHLIIDARNDGIEERVSLISYLNYTLNFTTFVSDPIQRYQDFARYQLATVPLELDLMEAGRAFERIIVGFFKVNVVSLLLSMEQTRALNTLHLASSPGSRLWHGVVIIAIYPLYLYCNFSGYIDMVIGIARFLRMELPENFNRPFSAGNFMAFWSRWHITLSEWLKNYVYNPLLMSGMRRYPSRALEPFLSAFAIFVTFFLVGIWHGQTTEFLFFGILQGSGVAAVQIYQSMMIRSIGKKRYKALAGNDIYRPVCRGLTFAWFAFTLLWFWSNWIQIGDLMQMIGTPLLIAALFTIFAGAAGALEVWERMRAALLEVKLGGEVLVLSRYTRTIWNTAAAVVAIAMMMLMDAPAPELVYKAFKN